MPWRTRRIFTVSPTISLAQQIGIDRHNLAEVVADKSAAMREKNQTVGSGDDSIRKAGSGGRIELRK